MIIEFECLLPAGTVLVLPKQRMVDSEGTEQFVQLGRLLVFILVIEIQGRGSDALVVPVTRR